MTDYAFDAKFPDEELDYQISLKRDLRGDTLSSVTITLSGDAALVKGTQSFTAAGVITVRLSGGTAGQTPKVNVLAVTATGQDIGATVSLPIVAR